VAEATADTATDAKGGGMEVIDVDDEDEEEDEEEDEVVDDVDAGDDDRNDGGIGVPVGGATGPAADVGGCTTKEGGGGGLPPYRPPEPQPGTPWPAPSGGCPPATKTGGSAILC